MTITKREALEMALSWARVFGAASLAQFMAGVSDWRIVLNAGVVAVLPVIIRYLDPQDKVYGRGLK
jgi:hypothetical protein